jgi:hypothetical protein
MSIYKNFLRLRYIDFLVRRKATGDYETFAKKNHLSKAGLSKVIKDMKEMGFPIKYDKTQRTYFYTKDGQMVEQLFFEGSKILSRDDMKEVGGEDVNNLCFSVSSIFEPCEKN